MKKIFTLLSNVSKIFKYADIFCKLSTGLRIAMLAVQTALKEIKDSNPDFKYIKTLETVISFMDTAKQLVDSFISIFGILPPADDDGTKGDGDATDALSSIDESLKGFLNENR